MESLDVDQILNGLSDPSFKEHKLSLLQILCNKCIDDIETNLPVESIYNYCIDRLSFLASKKYISTPDEVEESNYLLLALTNITSAENNQKTLVHAILSNESTTNVKWNQIIQYYLKYDVVEEQLIEISSIDVDLFWLSHDPFQNFSSILCNLSQREEFQQVITRRSSGIMEKLLTMVKTKNTNRRRGVVGIIKNCLFDKENHWWFVEELKILSYILPPLITPTPFTDKEKDGMNPLLFILAENPSRKPDEDIDILVMLMECIVLLCQTRVIRQILRKSKVYPICRNLDYFLVNDRINDVMHEIVNFLERDDDPNEL